MLFHPEIEIWLLRLDQLSNKPNLLKRTNYLVLYPFILLKLTWPPLIDGLKLFKESKNNTKKDDIFKNLYF